MPQYDYRCRSGHSTELLRPMAVEIVPCPTCGDLAERVPFNHVAIVVNDTMTFGATTIHAQNGRADIESPETRQKFRRFQEATQERDYAYAKVEADIGHPIQGPDLWSQSKEGAKEIALAGEAPEPARKD